MRIYDVMGNDVVVTRGAVGLWVSWGPFLPGALPRKPLTQVRLKGISASATLSGWVQDESVLWLWVLD
jgi:hypothetical protein